MCLVAVLDRAGVRPIDYDPAIEQAAEKKQKFDPRLYSPDELERIENVLRLLMEPRSVVEKPEGAGPVRTRDRA